MIAPSPRPTRIPASGDDPPSSLLGDLKPALLPNCTSELGGGWPLASALEPAGLPDPAESDGLEAPPDGGEPDPPDPVPPPTAEPPLSDPDELEP